MEEETQFMLTDKQRPGDNTPGFLLFLKLFCYGLNHVHCHAVSGLLV